MRLPTRANGASHSTSDCPSALALRTCIPNGVSMMANRCVFITEFSFPCRRCICLVTFFSTFSASTLHFSSLFSTSRACLHLNPHYPAVALFVNQVLFVNPPCVLLFRSRPNQPFTLYPMCFLTNTMRKARYITCLSRFQAKRTRQKYNPLAKMLATTFSGLVIVPSDAALLLRSAPAVALVARHVSRRSVAVVRRVQ